MIRNLIIIIGAMAALLFGANAMAQGNHVAHCDGASEVPPFDTQGQCQAIFKVRNGNLSYKLNGANLMNVVAAHIHCAPVGANGPVGVTLFGGCASDGHWNLGPRPDPGTRREQRLWLV